MTQTLDHKASSYGNLSVTEEHKKNPLGECVENAVKEYFKHLEGHPVTNLYDMLLAEVEAPLLKATLEHTNGNQSRAAEILGLNRGTLRKKLKTYGL